MVAAAFPGVLQDHRLCTMGAMRTIVLVVLNLCLPAAAFAQAGTCAGMSLGPLASLNGFVPFPSNNLWNTDISSAPVDPNSANLIDYIGANVTLHPDFGSGLYDGQSMGIPYQIEPGTKAMVPVKITAYPSQSDPGPMPIPSRRADRGLPGAGVRRPSSAGPRPGRLLALRAISCRPRGRRLVRRLDCRLGHDHQ